MTSKQANGDGLLTNKHGHQLVSQHCNALDSYMSASTQQSSNTSTNRLNSHVYGLHTISNQLHRSINNSPNNMFQWQKRIASIEHKCCGRISTRKRRSVQYILTYWQQKIPIILVRYLVTSKLLFQVPILLFRLPICLKNIADNRIQEQKPGSTKTRKGTVAHGPILCKTATPDKQSQLKKKTTRRVQEQKLTLCKVQSTCTSTSD